MEARTYLRKFTPAELVLDDHETKMVLQFIFGRVDQKYINSMQVSDLHREFAQALLVEAIDASFQIGFVEALFRSTINPTAGVSNTLKSFAKKASVHWFEHLTAKELKNIKVYEIVRLELARRFRTSLRVLNLSNLKKFPSFSYVRANFHAEHHSLLVVWS
ncbi:hypothetical protein [Photobacterium gaetbulicola]|uniref:hypothetical protein n=1 Tax=Photobacterium gaetbulicola TaxID=1295392 RepID=UPI00068AEFC7|nr:hypothetical protein [Photobacterium gaetbulicola]